MCIWIKRGSWFSATNGNVFSLCRTQAQELAFASGEIHVVKRKREKTERNKDALSILFKTKHDILPICLKFRC